MRGVDGKSGKRRFRFSYILLALAIITYLGTWAYSTYAADWKAKANIPKIDPVLAIIKGLRQYQKATATFPQTFFQVEKQIWGHQTPPLFGTDGRSLVLSNYFYLYTFEGPTKCTLWAIPVGPSTADSNSYFLVLMPGDREKWKGPALDLTEASEVNGTPTFSQLAILGMIKQDPLPSMKQ